MPPLVRSWIGNLFDGYGCALKQSRCQGDFCWFKRWQQAHRWLLESSARPRKKEPIMRTKATTKRTTAIAAGATSTIGPSAVR